MNETQEYLLKLVDGKEAHDDFLSVAARFTPAMINKKVPARAYTPWHLIEHIRITQKDIVDYTIGTNYKELDWPKDYWPAVTAKATMEDWNKTIKEYKKDIEKLKDLITNKFDTKILKRTLLVVDHTAYHTGELSLARSALKKKSAK